MKHEDTNDLRKAKPVQPVQASGNGRPAVAPEAFPQKRWHFWAAIALLIILPFILYYPSLHAPFIFDDAIYIVENPQIKEWLSDKPAKSYEPEQAIVEKIQKSRWITFMTFAMNYRLGGLNTFGYHFFNLAIHTINGLLVFLVVRSIFLSIGIKMIAVPALAALLFAAHPMNTEVVSYVSHRSEGLVCMFYLLSILLFFGAANNRKFLNFASLLCFGLGFFSKEIAITLPLALFMIDYFFISDMDLKKVLAKWKIHLPYWFILIGLIVYRQVSLGGIKDYAEATSLRWNRISYIAVQPLVIFRYILLLLLPVNQSIDHFIQPFKSLWDWRFVAPGLGLLAIGFLAHSLWKMKTLAARIILFSILWFFVILIPTSLLPINDAMTERRVYLAGLGFSLSASFVTELLQQSWSKLPRLLLMLYVLILCGLTWNRNRMYSKPILLWQEVISAYPTNDRAFYNLGVLLSDVNDPGQAAEAYQRAIEHNPSNDRARYNLGEMKSDQGDWDKAKKLYEEAIRINPNNSKAYGNLGFILAMKGEDSKALQNLEQAIKLNPRDAKSYNTLGTLFQKRGDYPRAEIMFIKAVNVNPSFQQAHFNLGLLYIIGRDFVKAKEPLQNNLNKLSL